MGLEKQIEKIFQRAMESDLDLIAQDISADDTNTTPQGSCMCACGIIATLSEPELRTEKQLYSIRRIVFRPLKDFWDITAEELANGGNSHASVPHHGSLEALLEKRRSGRAGRYLVDNQVSSLISVKAEHYRANGPSVTIVPRSEGRVISLGVLDYVWDNCSQEQLKDLVETNQLHIPSIGPLDRWPEEVEIIDRNGSRLYIRADRRLAFLSPEHMQSATKKSKKSLAEKNVQTLEEVRKRVLRSTPAHVQQRKGLKFTVGGRAAFGRTTPNRTGTQRKTKERRKSRKLPGYPTRKPK